MKKDTKEILEIVNFIKDRMATKDDVVELNEKIDDVRLELKQDIDDTRAEIRGKIGGLHQRLDEELDKRKQIEVRVSRLETKVDAIG